ncbi:hypothetical protein FA13DRAFT_955099 [Coprinellus micaceus]|uniref:Uncharacterized protein n=1 Tax=Coprinellus micaceus TaxID=71717 RepID=A0A4Y7RXA8_COPMI|nr:hypothetical protein FA13DRAFT_955099 [Coprinellus micaceus]
MCYRKLRFAQFQSQDCSHKEYLGETPVDCGQRDCSLSTSHEPTHQRAPNGEFMCRCKRYYTQPERITERTELVGKCAECIRGPPRYMSSKPTSSTKLPDVPSGPPPSKVPRID